MIEIIVKDKIINTAKIRRLVIRGDAIDQIRFCIKRYCGDIDLSSGTFKLKYKLPSGTVGYNVCTTENTEEYVYVDWLPQGGATSENGSLTIQLEAVIDENIWQTRETKIHVFNSITPAEYEYHERIQEEHILIGWLLSEAYSIDNIVYAEGDIVSADITLPNGDEGILDNILSDSFGITSLDYTFDKTYRLTINRDEEGEITDTDIAVIGG